MAELVDEIVVPEVDTDFALLSVTQQWQERPDADVFATSMPGAIGMVCGSRYANSHMTVQRWSDRPPEVSDEWEDVDEIPFEPVAEAGPLYVVGFDAPGPDGPGLDVGGLGRSVARVCASGRRIGDRVGEDVDPTDEKWLIQLWPDDDGGHNPMYAAPRRLKTALKPPATFDELEGYSGVGDPYYHAFPATWDVFHLMWWSPDQILRSTLFAIAFRLAVSLDHVIGAIVALVRLHGVTCSIDPRTVDPYQEIEIRR